MTVPPDDWPRLKEAFAGARALPAHRPWRPFDLHPDGERFAIGPAVPAPGGAKQDTVVFIFNFFDELRRIAQAR